MKYVIDIDGTICTNTYGNYEHAQPNLGIIKKINNLFSDGQEIILFTARGMGRFDDRMKAEAAFMDLTIYQLDKWEVKYHKLIFGKPSGDFYVDDKNMSLNGFIGGT